MNRPLPTGVFRIFLLPDSLLAWLDEMLERRKRLGEGITAFLLIFPVLLIIGLFWFLPMLSAVTMSFYGGKRGNGSFIGLANYMEALQTPDFWRSLTVTIYYVAGVVPATLVISFFLAWLLHHTIRARGFFRTIFFLPYVTSVVAAATIWRGLCNPQGGVLNLLLTWVGIPGQHWLLEPKGVLHLISQGMISPEIGPSLSLCCIMAFDIWHGCGFMVIVFLAGLTAVPRELEEAARIDGAGCWGVLRQVTLPMISPTIFFLLIVGVIKAFQAFNSFYALTQGGGNTTDTRNMVSYVYSQFYDYGYWGYGTAVSTLLTIAIMCLTAIQWRFARNRVYYQ